MSKVLIVEDEKNLGETLTEYLESQGYLCAWSASAHTAREKFSSFGPNLVLMDIGLPDGDGLLLAQEFKKNDPSSTILFLSAFNDPELRVQGLELGAYDYITKPFALKELLLRMKRIFKPKRSSEISHGPLKIRFSGFEVEDACGKTISLGQKEKAILEFLYEKKGCVLNRDEIIEKVWGEDSFPSNRTVDNYIVKLRRWCESDPNQTIAIQSVWGIGYKLMVKEEEANYGPI